jgi:cephalosporin hydroxylase
MLPPSVDIDLERDTLLSYWRARVAQHTQDSYAGVTLSKFPEDLRVYEHLLWLQAPDTVIEIGTQFGASALWFRDRLRALRAYGRISREPRVVTLDIDQSRAREALAGADPGFTREIALVEGDVRDPAVADEVAGLVGESARCLVVEDSAHTHETTMAALSGFSRFVPPGGFFVVEDGCVDVEVMRIDEAWPRGVLPALDDWLRTPAGAEFAVRRDLELYGMSCHPRGFLQRRDETLEDELRSGAGWMYPWELGTPDPLPLLNPELPSVHSTRLELIEEPVRAALDAAGPEPTAIDLACSEGWFAHRLLDWGAARVVGIDLREANVRRARIVRNALGVPPARLELRQGDIFALDTAELGTFYVVLLLGLVYHVEDPVGALRRARAMTRGVCAIESQLTRQSAPVDYGWGRSDQLEEAAESLVLRVEGDAHVNPVASAPGIASLVPNRAALEAMASAAGFGHLEWCEPLPHHNRQYREGDRAVLIARP